MKKLALLLTQILACGMLAGPASAAFLPQATAIPGSVPQGINYQGRLEDNGFPVSATKQMIFRVYDAPAGGTLLWTSPAQGVAVAIGLFNAAVPVPITALVGGGARYLEVQIDGTTMSPRELLNSVPYALIAKSIEGTIDVSTAGLAINANPSASQPSLYISSQTGNVGVGTGSPAASFDVGGNAQFGAGATKSTFTATGSLALASSATINGGYGSVPAAAAANSLVFGSGGIFPDAASSAFGDGTGWKYHVGTKSAGVFSPLLSVQDNGNVGVGTANPGTKLHMSSGTLTIDGSAATALTTVGSVGVGTPSPATKLDVNGNAQFGSGANKSTFTATGALTMAAGAAITGNLTGTVTGNAATATALAADPADAASGYVARGIDASGTVQPAWVETAATSGSTNPVTSGAMFTALALKAPLASPTFTGIVSGANLSMTNAVAAAVVSAPGSVFTSTTAVFNGGNVGVGTGIATVNDKLEIAGGNVRLTAVAGSAGSVTLFPTLTVGAVTCTAQCGATAACLAAWTSAGVVSACATPLASNRCLCAGFGN